MRDRLLQWVCGALAPVLVAAQTPSPTPAPKACEQRDNRVLGPRTSNRPLPLLSGDATRGFHPACTVPWRTLSPRNEALPVTGCYRGSLLQIPNDSACGGGTGPLWVSSRWVMTSAELLKPAARAATCQQLDTGAWAGTRGFDFDCVPQKKTLKSESAQVPADSGTRRQENSPNVSPAAARSRGTGPAGGEAASAADTRAAPTKEPPVGTAPANAASGPQL